MTTDKTARHQAEEHALRVFEERNRAFRVLFDTVMEVEGESDQAILSVLCRNLLRLCEGQAAALATYDPAMGTMTLECACRRTEPGEVSFLDQPGITAKVAKQTVDKFLEKQVQECDVHQGCLVDIFSGSALDSFGLRREKNCYRLSCVRDGELIAGGMVQLAPGSLLQLKDMIDTYLNLAGLIIQRIYITRSLQESESRLRTFFESMQPGILIIDSETHRIADINSSAAQMIGLPRDKIVGSICHRFICPREEGKCPITDQGKELDREERILVRATGAEVPILKTVTPITIKGRPHLLESFIDITEQKRNEETLLRHSLVYRSMQEAVLIFDREDRIIDINPAAETLFGWSLDELRGQKADTLNPPDRTKEIVAGIREGLEKDGVWEGEIPVITKSGELRIMSTIVSSIYDREGRWIGNVGINRDITERKQAEAALRESQERFRLAAECASDLIYEWKVADNTLEWFGDIDRALGYEPGTFPRTLDAWRSIIHPDDLPHMEEAVQQQRDAGKAMITEYRIRHRNGEWLYWMDRGTGITDESGKTIKMIGVCTDFTIRRRLEEEVLKTQKLDSLGVLAGGIAHDFNNLLMSIMGNVSLAKLNLPEDTDLRLSLDEAEASCIQAKNLTQQLLTFSRGGLPIKKIVSIADLIRESAGFSLSGSSSKAAFTIADDLWPVEVDTGQIHQVINNLVINAGQAMPEGGLIEIGAENITVTDELGLPLKEGRYLRLSFRDRGVGIPDKYLDKIFDPYFTTKKQGSGLGLATVYSIIKNHGGLITVHSDPDRGTVFTIHLPAAEREPAPAISREEQIVRGKGKVLLMDDEVSVRTVCVRMLKSLGYEVATAEDGKEAIEMFRRARADGDPFDCVILDLTIKDGMGGEETARELNKLDPGVKTIVTSGYSMDAIMADYEKHGFCGVIVKPYRMKDLSALLSRVMEESPAGGF